MRPFDCCALCGIPWSEHGAGCHRREVGHPTLSMEARLAAWEPIMLVAFDMDLSLIAKANEIESLVMDMPKEHWPEAVREKHAAYRTFHQYDQDEEVGP